MMRKWIAILMALAALTAFAACRNDEDPDEGQNGTYSFLYENVEIAVGDKAAPVLESLRAYNPQSSVKASCLSGVAGEDVTYVLPGFRIQTFRLQEGDADEQIRLIILSDDSVSTREGIAIGAAAQSVKDVYGEADEETEYRLSYTRGTMRLAFGLRDGTVTNISYEIIE